MKSLVILIMILFLSFIKVYSQSNTIAEANPFCSDTGILFQNTSDGSSGETGPDYGCLDSEPNPSWFYIKIIQPGNLSLKIEQNRSADFTAGRGLDVDFIAWGPFSEEELDKIKNGDVSFLNAVKTVDCSYSDKSTETLNINDALEEEYYLILITNFNGSDGFIRMNESHSEQPGTGKTTCSIVVGELGFDQDVCEGTTVTLDGTSSSNDINYKWFVDTGAGFTEITGETDPILVIDNNKSGTYKVEITNNDGDTNDDDVMITFYKQPIIIIPPSDINRCDDGLNSFLDFDLQTEQTPQILNGLDPSLNIADFEVLYFDNLTDAQVNTTAAVLPNPYRVNTADNPTIYARVHNIQNKDCYTITDFKLKITDVPVPTQPTSYRLCDDADSGSDTDQKSSFLLNTKDAEILTGVTNPNNYTISYHTNLMGAQTDNTTDVIDKNIPYQVTISQRVYVRVENKKNTDCNVISDDNQGSTFTSFELIVDSSPIIIIPPSDINRCDDGLNGFLDFDLQTEQTPQILNGLDPSLNIADFEVLYFDNLTDAQANTTAAVLPNPYRVNTADNPTIMLEFITFKIKTVIL